MNTRFFAFKGGLSTARSRHQGFSLVTVMIILVVVSLLGVAASQIVLLSERSARYDRDWQIAFQAAEAALLDAEFDIRGPGGSRAATFTPTSQLGFSTGCSTDADRGRCLPAATGKPVWYSVDFTNEKENANTAQFGEFTGRTLASGTAGIQPALRPRYIIEAVPDLSPGGNANAPKFLYRVTAMGFGPRKETQAVVQMYFRKE